MATLIIQNGKIITPFRTVEGGYIALEDGRIAEVSQRPFDAAETGALVIDARGAYVSPGFIDIHVHGGGGFEVMEAEVEGIRRMCMAHAAFGTTSIVPTTMSASMEDTYRAIGAVRQASEGDCGANIVGIHLEGPYLSSAQRGAQAEDHLRTPLEEEYAKLLDAWDGIRIVGVAPELPGAMALGRELRRRGIVASIAHSDADYDTVAEALENGFTDVTHIYSGCSTVRRVNAFRVAGVVESGFLFDELTVQVIADGKHLPKSLLELIYKTKGADRISLVTDGLSFSAQENVEGMEYMQRSGVPVVYEDGVMKLIDRQSFAGSAATTNVLVRNMVKLAGATVEDAVKMASLTPAHVLGIGDRKGILAKGMDADIAIFDERFQVLETIVNGRQIKRG
ncbi:MAG: N-acetylglucosamine-6-phosphate deacetylase [Clostridiales bacterium]|nr:N-acetylglucosamine-6-phosphate deacetylase [Clostridiales bacterium]